VCSGVCADVCGGVCGEVCCVSNHYFANKQESIQPRRVNIQCQCKYNNCAQYNSELSFSVAPQHLWILVQPLQ
jgi:hypothetical protein